MEEVLKKYKPGKEIARGTFATVFLCLQKKTNTPFALKVVDKAEGPQDREGLAREVWLLAEVEILQALRHPNVVAFEEFFELETAYAVVMEMVPGGELLERLQEKERYSENDARTLMRVLLETVAYIHANDVVHRDLKPENVLLLDRTTDTHVKIIDFGLAKTLDPGDGRQMRTMCGTPEYCAPELLKGYTYTSGVDIFATGIMAFLLVSGYHPFRRYRAKDGTLRDDGSKVVRRICRGSYEFNVNVSDECKDLISRLLAPNPENRITAAGALNHRWFDEDALAPPMLQRRDLSGSLADMRDFNMKRHLRSAILSVIGIGRMETVACCTGALLAKPAEPNADAAPTPSPPPPGNAATGSLGPAGWAGAAASRNGSAAAEIREMMLGGGNDDAAAAAAGGMAASVRLIQSPKGRVVTPGFVDPDVTKSATRSPPRSPRPPCSPRPPPPPLPQAEAGGGGNAAVATTAAGSGGGGGVVVGTVRAT